MDERPAVVCLGETMALLVPADAEHPDLWRRSIGGAESNVACGLAGLGVASAWIGAVGADAFGEQVRASVAAHGVDITGVRTDPDRVTGLYLKERGGAVRYYRAGSAAAALGPEVLDDLDLAAVRLVHTSGITPALSPSCAELMRRLFAVPRATHHVSFDLNWRAPLWRGRDVGILHELADAADIVLVGDDEALAVWGIEDVAGIRALLPGPSTLVVKHGARGATLVERDADGTDRPAVFQSALRVDVTEPVGAGDAFAAGFLAGTLAGESPRRRLRRGHLQAASALRTHNDIGAPPPPALVDELLDADDASWAAAHLRGDAG